MCSLSPLLVLFIKIFAHFPPSFTLWPNLTRFLTILTHFDWPSLIKCDLFFHYLPMSIILSLYDPLWLCLTQGDISWPILTNYDNQYIYFFFKCLTLLNCFNQFLPIWPIFFTHFDLFLPNSDTVWLMLIYFDHYLTILINIGQLWHILIHFNPFWSILSNAYQFLHIWTPFDKLWPYLSNVDQVWKYFFHFNHLINTKKLDPLWHFLTRNASFLQTIIYTFLSPFC